MNDEFRDLHILAGGTPRVERMNGREYLVVPVVALMEGVIHAVNADTPEFVSSDVLRMAAHTWNGRPLVVGHPTKDGRQISANDPIVLQQQAFGTIFNSKSNGTRLGMEAWVDPERLETLGQQDMLAKIRAGTPMEISVGAHVKTDSSIGVHNGRSYKAIWRDTVGDHLAFLPKGRGACSLEMGCGAYRTAHEQPLLHVMHEDYLEVLGGPGSGNFGHGGRPGEKGGSSSDDGNGPKEKKTVLDAIQHGIEWASESDYSDEQVAALHSSKKKIEGGQPLNSKEKEITVDALTQAMIEADDEEETEEAARYENALKKLKTLGGPGSGWTAEGGHVPGAQGGKASGSSMSKGQAKSFFKKAVDSDKARVSRSGNTITVKASQGGKTVTASVTKEGASELDEADALETVLTAVSTGEAKIKSISSTTKFPGASRTVESSRLNTKLTKAYDPFSKKRNLQEHKMSLIDRLKGFFKALGPKLEDKDLEALASIYDTPEQAQSEETAELIGYQALDSHCETIGTCYDEIKSLIDDLISDEEDNPTSTAEQEEAETEVEHARLNAIENHAMLMMSALQGILSCCNKALTPHVEPTSPRYAEDLRAAVGARNNRKDKKTIQEAHDTSYKLHDYAMNLGAECNCPEMKTLAENNSGGVPAKGDSTMTKVERETAVKALIDCKCSDFTAEDQKALESMTDERLTQLRTASEARVEERTKEKKDLEDAQAKITALEAKKTEEPKQMTEDEFMKAAPASIRTLVERTKAQDEVRKTELVEKLKTAQTAYTETELKALELNQLEKLASVAKLDVPSPDYSGRGVVRTAAADDVYANPPNPYGDEALKKHRAAMERTN